MRLFSDEFLFTVLIISDKNSAVELSNSRQKENVISMKKWIFEYV